MIMKRFKTIGIITNYYFDYDMECYVYDLAILMNGHFVKNKYYTYDDEDAAIFSKEILEKFNERSQNTTSECDPLAVKLKAIYTKDNHIKLKHLSLENGPKITVHKTSTPNIF